MITFNLIKRMLDKKHFHIRQILYTQMIAIIIFAIIYYLVSLYLLNKNIKTQFDSLYECFYLSLITQSTLGYDKIIEEHKYIKNIQILQIITIFILINLI